MRWLKRLLFVFLGLIVLLAVLAGGTVYYYTPEAGPPLLALVPDNAVHVLHAKRVTSLTDSLTGSATWHRFLDTGVALRMDMPRLLDQWKKTKRKFEKQTGRSLDADTVNWVATDDALVVVLPTANPRRPQWFAAFRTGTVGNAVARENFGLDAGELTGHPTGRLAAGGKKLPFAMLGDVWIVAADTDALAAALAAGSREPVKTVDLDPEPETPYRVAARVTPNAWPLPDLKDLPAKKTRDGRAASVHEVLRSTAVDWSGLPYPVTRIDMALSYDDPDVVEETRVAFDPQAIATTETADPDQVATALTLRALRQRQLQPWPLAPFIPDDAILARSWQPHSGYYLMFALDRMPLPNEIAQRPDLARRAAALVEQWAMGEVVPTIDDVVGFAIMPQSGGLNETPPPAIQWLVPSLQPEKTREELTDGLQRQVQRITGASSLTLPGRTPLLKTIEQDGMVQVVLGAREVGVEPTRRPGLAMIGDWLVLTTSEASLAEANQRRKKQQPRLLDNPDSVTRLLGRPAHHHLFFQCPRDLPQLYRHYETFLKDSPQQVQRGSDKRDQAVRDALQILSLVDRMARTSTYTSDDAVMMKARWRMAK